VAQLLCQSCKGLNSFKFQSVGFYCLKKEEALREFIFETRA